MRVRSKGVKRGSKKRKQKEVERWGGQKYFSQLQYYCREKFFYFCTVKDCVILY